MWELVTAAAFSLAARIGGEILVTVIEAVVLKLVVEVLRSTANALEAHVNANAPATAAVRPVNPPPTP